VNSIDSTGYVVSTPDGVNGARRKLREIKANGQWHAVDHGRDMIWLRGTPWTRRTQRVKWL
jgi:hypothetical protein